MSLVVSFFGFIVVVVLIFTHFSIGNTRKASVLLMLWSVTSLFLFLSSDFDFGHFFSLSLLTSIGIGDAKCPGSVHTLRSDTYLKERREKEGEKKRQNK